MDLYNLSLKTAPYPAVTCQFILPPRPRAPTQPEQDGLGTNPPAVNGHGGRDGQTVLPDLLWEEGSGQVRWGG